MAKSTLGSMLISLELSTATLNNQIKGAEKSFTKMGSNIKKIVGTLAIGSVFKDITKAGLKYNSQLETTKNSIAGLLVATSKLKDVNGKVITQQELYNNAMSESTGILKELQLINSETPMGLDETAQIYKSMLPSMRAVGASQENLIKLTKNLAIASGVAGIKTNQLLAGVDGLATGTVLANSELGRFLNALGLNNKELKNSTDVVGLLNEKLGKLKGEITMETQLSTLSENWNSVLGQITKTLFENSKTWIQTLSDFLSKFKSSIPDIAIYFEASFITIGQKWDALIAGFVFELEDFKDTVKQTFEFFTSSGMLELSYNVKLENARKEVDATSSSIKSFTRNMLDLYEALPDEEIISRTVGKKLENALDIADKKAKKLNDTVKKSRVQLTDWQQFIADSSMSLAQGGTSMFRAWMDGATNFKDMFGSILKDITAQMFYMLGIKQLLSGIGGGIGGSVGTALSSVFEKGGAISGGVQAFASGGIVNSPTVFPMASGMGLMGEAGAEAVMPLTRTSSGNLGVEATASPVTVNVNNYGNDEVSVEQSGKYIDITISKISNDITRGTGTIGTAIESRYGLKKQ